MQKKKCPRAKQFHSPLHYLKYIYFFYNNLTPFLFSHRSLPMYHHSSALPPSYASIFLWFRSAQGNRKGMIKIQISRIPLRYMLFTSSLAVKNIAWCGLQDFIIYVSYFSLFYDSRKAIVVPETGKWFSFVSWPLRFPFSVLTLHSPHFSLSSVT